MRNMSFALTADQILNQTKTVTRRLGWQFLRPGDLIQPVKKCQGLKAGEKVERLGPPIKVTSVRREPLEAILNEWSGAALEGFSEMTTRQFWLFFSNANKCPLTATVTRIGFEYMKGEGND
jgi:hypothetical protein